MNVTLPTVLVEGLYSALPAPGIPGRLFFASDTKKHYYDNGTGWDDITPAPAVTKVALAPSAAGNFTVAHGMGRAPVAVLLEMSSGGQIWLQNPTGYDATDLYFVASDAGITGNAVCF